MRRAGGGMTAAAVVLLSCACTSPQTDADPAATTFATVWPVVEPGTGLLLLSDLDVDDDRFDAPVQTVDAVLRMRPDDCLVVVVDGVEHVPVWPAGTALFAQRRSRDDPGADRDAATRWGIALPDRSTLWVDGADRGESFTAQAVVARPREADAPADAGTQPEIVDPHLAACGVPAPPIAFPDAAAIVTEWEKTYADPPVDPAPSPHAERADAATSRTVELSVDEHQLMIGRFGDELATDVLPALPWVWARSETSPS